MVSSALQWIADLLSDNEIPYLVCGGVAAHAYGSKRPINDIDIFVRAADFQNVTRMGRDFVSKPARHATEENEGWHVEYVQFEYQGTKVEVGSDEGVKILDFAREEWVALALNFSNTHEALVLGVRIPLMEKSELISYKRILGRAVDLEDVLAIESVA